jgi:hypothetical protein
LFPIGVRNGCGRIESGCFESSLNVTTKHATLPALAEIWKAFAAHAMTVVGPPLEVD